MELSKKFRKWIVFFFFNLRGGCFYYYLFHKCTRANLFVCTPRQTRAYGLKCNTHESGPICMV
jgi:hypothetical protein